MNFDLPNPFRSICAPFCFALLAACAVETPGQKPLPDELTRDDTGYFCGMIVEDHAGPKSQVFLKGKEQPLWFTTVRDGIAFLRLPEETRPVTVLYVTTMDAGEWDHPEAEAQNWTEIGSAWFVIESRRLGSMGAPEAIPFARQQAAESFASEYGGRVLALAEIPDSYILSHGEEAGVQHTGH